MSSIIRTARTLIAFLVILFPILFLVLLALLSELIDCFNESAGRRLYIFVDDTASWLEDHVYLPICGE